MAHKKPTPHQHSKTSNKANTKAGSKSKLPKIQLIAKNRKARHDFEILQQIEAGLCLEGWEVKSIRAGRVQLKESYVIIRQNEAWIIGAHITPLASASTHIKPDPTRSRKLLLARRQLDQFIGAVQNQGLTLVALDMHWHNRYIKLQLALVRGKKAHDKRQTEKDRDWQRQKQRIMSHSNR